MGRVRAIPSGTRNLEIFMYVIPVDFLNHSAPASMREFLVSGLQKLGIWELGRGAFVFLS